MNKDTLLEIPGVEDVSITRWWDCDGNTWRIYFDIANVAGGTKLHLLHNVASAFPVGCTKTVCASTEGYRPRLYLEIEVPDELPEEVQS
jgi:hypothetical protein